MPSSVRQRALLDGRSEGEVRVSSTPGAWPPGGEPGPVLPPPGTPVAAALQASVDHRAGEGARTTTLLAEFPILDEFSPRGTRRATLERRVLWTIWIKQYFLLFHLGYIVAVGLIAALILWAAERRHSSVVEHVSFLDALFMGVSAVTCTGLETVPTDSFFSGSSVAWHIAVFLGSTVLTSITPSLLRLTTLSQLHQLELGTPADAEEDAAQHPGVGASRRELRRHHMAMLRLTSKLMVVATLSYLAVFVLLAVVLLCIADSFDDVEHAGFWRVLSIAVSAFGNAGILQTTPRGFERQWVNLVALAIIVPAGSTLFPVFLRLWVAVLRLCLSFYVRVVTRLAPGVGVPGDPSDWQIKVLEAEAAAATTSVVKTESTTKASRVAPPPPRCGGPIVGSPTVSAGRRGALDAESTPSSIATATTSDKSTESSCSGRRAAPRRASSSGEDAPLLQATQRWHSGTAAGYGLLNPTGSDRRSEAPLGGACTPTVTSDVHLATDDDGDSVREDELGYTGFQNPSVMVPTMVLADAAVAHRRVASNRYLQGFDAILASTKPVNHHPWLFIRSDTLYLFIAWSLIVALQFLPFTFQQWGTDGVLGKQPSEAMKGLLAWTQAACNRFSGIGFFNFSSLSPGQVCTVIFAMYLPALPIPTERTHRKWKQMFTGSAARLFLSRFWWLFACTAVILFLEETNAGSPASPARGPEERWVHGMQSRVLFEVVSAYSTSGLSMTLPGQIGPSLCAGFTVVSKLILMALMLAGRHRNMDLGLDIGLTDMAATERYEPERAKRTRQDVDLASIMTRSIESRQNPTTLRRVSGAAAFGGGSGSGGGGRHQTFESSSTNARTPSPRPPSSRPRSADSARGRRRHVAAPSDRG